MDRARRRLPNTTTKIHATHTTLLEWPVSNNIRAEGVGFEPTRSANPFRFSRPVPSATRRALHLQSFQYQGRVMKAVLNFDLLSV
jgi:hypothetical protein